MKGRLISELNYINIPERVRNRVIYSKHPSTIYVILRKSFHKLGLNSIYNSNNSWHLDSASFIHIILTDTVKGEDTQVTKNIIYELFACDFALLLTILHDAILR